MSDPNIRNRQHVVRDHNLDVSETIKIKGDSDTNVILLSEDGDKNGFNIQQFPV